MWLITKEDVLNELDVHIKNCHIINGYRFRNHSIGFRNSVLELLKALRDKVESTFLFDAPDDDTWFYTFEIDEESIRLNLALAHVEIESNGSILTYAIGGDNSHTLVEVAVPKYSVKEFTDIQCKSGN